MTFSAAPVATPQYRDAPECDLNVFLSKSAPVLPREVLKQIPLLFKWQARIENSPLAYIKGNTITDNLLRIQVEEPQLLLETDMPVITDEELGAAYDARVGDNGLEHIALLQTLVTSRMSTFSGVSVKFKLMGIIHSQTGDLQPMRTGNTEAPTAPWGWLGGHHSNSTNFKSDCIGTVIDEELYRQLHYYAALSGLISRFEGARAFFSNGIYGKKRIYLTPESNDSYVTFRLVQRRNPKTQLPVIGLQGVQLKGMKGLGLFCGSSSQSSKAEAAVLPVLAQVPANATLADAMDDDDDTAVAQTESFASGEGFGL